MRILILFLLFSSPAFATEPLATIGSNTIEKKTFENLFQKFQKKRPVINVSREEFLDELVKLELGYLEAKRLKLDVDPEINYQIKAIFLQGVIQKEIGDKIQNISVTEKDMKKYYKDHPQIRASHILLRVPPDATAEQKVETEKKIKEIYQQATKNKAAFGALAKKYSEDPSAKREGDLDYFTFDRMVKPFSDAAFSLKKIGDISNPVKTQFGWHIIQLTGIRSYKDADKNLLRQELLRTKRAEMYDEYFTTLIKRYKVMTFPKRLISQSP